MDDKTPPYPAVKPQSSSSHEGGSQADQFRETLSTMKLDLAPPATVTEQNLMDAQNLIDQTKKQGIPKKNANDFKFLQNLGEGSYSQVFRCREVRTDAVFAIKVLQKAHLARHDKTDAVIREKNILNHLTQECGGHPFITQLYTYFHDKTRFYIVMNLVEGGDLSESLCHFGSFDVGTTKFFASEIVTGLRFMHYHKIVHRDIKPENILIQRNGHISIGDFGSAQAIKGWDLSQEGFAEEAEASAPSSDSNSPPVTQRYRDYSDDEEENNTRRTTFVGTALYVSPEMLADGDVGEQTDVWGLGCIMFQCLAGQPPFRAVNQYHLLKKIQDLDFSFPEGFPDIAKDVIGKILVGNPKERITTDGLKRHEFFRDINWSQIETSTPPTLHAYCPATFGEPEYYSNIDCVEPGLDDRALFRLMNLGSETSSQPSTPSNADRTEPLVATPRTDSAAERHRAHEKKLDEQRANNPFHLFTGNQLIIKQGYLEKKRGLFARRRMFLLTEGPHLLYIDVPNLVLKGEVPWTPCMQIEFKNPGTFFIHTPNRVYYLFDLEKKADEWCKAIEQVRRDNARKIEVTFDNAMRDGTFGHIYGKKKSRKEMIREQKALKRKQEKEEKKALKAEQQGSKKLSMQMDKK